MATGDHSSIAFTVNARRHPLFLVMLLLVCVVLFVGCGGGNATASAPSTPTATPTPMTSPTPTPVVGVTHVSITITAKYQPANIQVAVGTTVSWTNNDTTSHTVTFRISMQDSRILLAGGKQIVPDTFASQQGMKDSGILPPQEGTVSFTFMSRGIFPYYCAIHPSMQGVVTVT
jgi:plastocyanin